MDEKAALDNSQVKVFNNIYTYKNYYVILNYPLIRKWHINCCNYITTRPQETGRNLWDFNLTK
jgi:hypothetical protein